MFVYLLLAAAPAGLAAVLYGLKKTYRLQETPYREKILFVFFAIYFLLLALRGPSVGVDVERYLSRFQYAQGASLSQYLENSSSETGFIVLTKLISTVTESGQIYLVIMAFAAVFPIAWLYCRESEGPLLTISLFLILPVFGIIFSGLRQAIAMGLAVPAYCCVRKRRKGWFLLTVLLAACFHRSAWVLLALYPVYHAKLTRKSLLWIVPLLVVLYSYNAVVFRLLLSLLFQDASEYYSEMSNTGARNMLILFSLFLIFSYVFVERKQADPETTGLQNILTLSVALQCFAGVHTLAMRVNYYFLVFLPLLIPRIIHRSTRENAAVVRIAGVVICVFCFVYFLLQAYEGDSGFGIYPYVPFWKV